MRPIDIVLARLDDPRPSGKDRWRAACPACGGSNRSALSIGVGDAEAVLLRCWKGCNVEQVTQALGLELHELFPGERSPGAGSRPLKKRRLLGAIQAMQLLEFETMLVWTAAFNLANGHALKPDDLDRLAVAAHRITTLAQEVAA